MRTRIIETGFSEAFVIRGEGVRDDRNCAVLAQEFQKYGGIVFGKEQLAQLLFDRFPHSQLALLEGGCGFAHLLAELAEYLRSLDVASYSTGISLDPTHAEVAARAGRVNEMVVGSVQQHFQNDGFQRKYHAIIDFYGALSYDLRPFGATILPIYSHIIQPGGIVVLASSFVLGYPSPQQEIQRRDAIIESYGFQILFSQNGFIIAQQPK